MRLLTFRLLMWSKVISSPNRATQAMKLINVNEPNRHTPLCLLNRHLPSYQADDTQE